MKKLLPLFCDVLHVWIMSSCGENGKMEEPARTARCREAFWFVFTGFEHCLSPAPLSLHSQQAPEAGRYIYIFTDLYLIQCVCVHVRVLSAKYLCEAAES